jgi:uncharacterized membrane protein
MLSFWILLLIVISTIAGAVGSLFYKKAAADFSLNLKKLLKNTNLFIGIIVFSSGTLIYLFTLSMGNLSVIYSLTSLSYIWIDVLSVKILGEKMNKSKWIGMGLIMIGIILISVVR